MQRLGERSEEELRAPSNQREAERGRERNCLIFLMQKQEINTPTCTVKTSPSPALAQPQYSSPLIWRPAQDFLVYFLKSAFTGTLHQLELQKTIIRLPTMASSKGLPLHNRRIWSIVQNSCFYWMIHSIPLIFTIQYSHLKSNSRISRLKWGLGKHIYQILCTTVDVLLKWIAHSIISVTLKLTLAWCFVEKLALLLSL